MTTTLTAPSKPPSKSPSSDRTRRRWSTPRWLLTLGALVVVLAAVFGIVLGTSAGAVSDGVDVIGDQAAPQVTATTDLSFALSDLDAQATNVLLVGTGENLGNDGPTAMAAYQKRRVQADQDLQQIAANGGNDPTEQRIVRQTLDNLGQYESLIGQAFLVSQQGHDPAGSPSPATVALYRQATGLMSTTLTGVRSLTTHEQDLLSATYTSDHATAVTDLVWVLLLGLLLLAALVGVQVVLRVRQRRRINPALAGATVLTLVVTVFGMVVFGGEAGHLTDAKQGAYDKVVVLSQARATSVDANADESRFLLDPAHAATYQQSFQSRVQSLATVPRATSTTYRDLFATTVQYYTDRDYVIGFGGDFATVLNQVDQPGERAATVKLLFAFQNYQSDDQALHVLADTGDIYTTIQFDISTDQFDSDWAFQTYDTALTNLTRINQQGFDDAIGAARSEVSGWTLVIPGLTALLVIGLLLLGLWPRVTEYRR
jgi:hypothetical protein